LKSLLLKILAGLLLLIAGLVLAVAVVNRKDEAPSAAAQAMKRIVEARESVADGDNAYVYILGFDAPDDSDALASGHERVEWLRKFMATAGPYQFPNPPGERQDLSELRNPEFRQFAAICKRDNRSCLEAMESDRLRLQAWVQRDAKLIARYQGLLAFTQWREVWPNDVRAPVAPLSHVLEAQRLMFIKAWLMASNGDAVACKQLLQRDLQFWRMALAETSSLVFKLVATSAIEQHFALGNLVLRSLPPAAGISSIPEAWLVPMSVRERSMATVMANEWAFSERYMTPSAMASYLEGNDDGAESGSLVSRLLAKLLLKPQATVNATAERMLSVTQLSERDYPAIPDAAKALLASQEFAKKDITSFRIYNPIGGILVDLVDMKPFVGYGLRIADLEGGRRLALLAAQLRGQNVSLENVSASLSVAGLRDPYDGSAFSWNAKESSYVFRRTLSGKPDLKLAF